MRIAQWDTVRVSSAAFRCEHCGASATAVPGANVLAFLPELRSQRKQTRVPLPLAQRLKHFKTPWQA
jgi:hypothetical protein